MISNTILVIIFGKISFYFETQIDWNNWAKFHHYISKFQIFHENVLDNCFIICY